MILSHGPLHAGSQYTKSRADELGRPNLHIDLAKVTVPDAVQELREWLARIRPRVLNVAGARASDDPGVYRKTLLILESLLVNKTSST
jgi:hypothetical protein